MSNPFRTRRIPLDDFSRAPEEVAQALEVLLEYLNPFISDTNDLLDRGLTWDNFRAVVKEVDVVAPFDTIKVSTPELQSKPQNVIVTRAVDVSKPRSPRPAVAPTLAWESANDGILIRAASGLVEQTKYRLRLLITV